MMCFECFVIQGFIDGSAALIFMSEVAQFLFFYWHSPSLSPIRLSTFSNGDVIRPHGRNALLMEITSQSHKIFCQHHKPCTIKSCEVIPVYLNQPISIALELVLVLRQLWRDVT